MSQNLITRRNALTSALGLGVGIGLLSIGNAKEAEKKSDASEKKEKRSRKKEQSTVWKYVPLDPAPAAQKAYEYYKVHGCMYGLVKAAILAYADAIEATDPQQAEICRNFPFDAFKYGRTGYGGQESMCGTVNGAGFFMSLFVESPTDLYPLQKKITDYVKETPLPEFVPAEDKYPNFVKSVSHSIICKDNTTTWLAQSDDPEHKQLRSERCKRFTGSILAFTIKTLNEYFANQDK